MPYPPMPYPHKDTCATNRYGGGVCNCDFDAANTPEEVEDPIPNDARLRDGQCECPRCGKGETFPVPMPIDAMTPWLLYFRIKHRWCKKS